MNRHRKFQSCGRAPCRSCLTETTAVVIERSRPARLGTTRPAQSRANGELIQIVLLGFAEDSETVASLKAGLCDADATWRDDPPAFGTFVLRANALPDGAPPGAATPLSTAYFPPSPSTL